MSDVSSSGTEGRAGQPVKQRAAVFSAVLAMHIGLILLLVLSRPPAPAQKQRGSLSVFSVAAAAPLARAIPVAVPVIPAKAEPVSPSLEEVFAEQQAVLGDVDGEICSPVDVVTAQLVSDPLVLPAIARVPREDRSISEAIVMWNSDWSPATIEGEAPLADVRLRVLLALSDLPTDCLAMPVVGPRLVPITGKEGTTFLAFGSGEWSWQLLVDNPDDTPSSEENSWIWKDLLARRPMPVV
jgi:hypothetical protein